MIDPAWFSYVTRMISESLSVITELNSQRILLINNNRQRSSLMLVTHENQA